MNMASKLFLLLFLCIALMALYHALFPLPAYVVFTRFFALSGFFLLCVVLMIGPLATIWPNRFMPLLESRRTIGIAAFVFIFMHFLLAFLLYYGLQASMLFSTPLMALALAATIALAVLALLSSDYFVRMLGFANWKNIQLLAYPVFLIALVHFLVSARGLFVPVGQSVFVNAAEIFAIAMGTATIVLQMVGFIVKRGKLQKQVQQPAR